MHASHRASGDGVPDTDLEAKYRAFCIAYDVRCRWQAAARDAYLESTTALGTHIAGDEVPLAARIVAERSVLCAGPYPDYCRIAVAAAAWLGRLALDIFAEPSAGPREIAVKLRVLRHILGTYGGGDDGDPELAAWQTKAPEAFIDTVLREVDELAATSRHE